MECKHKPIKINTGEKICGNCKKKIQMTKKWIRFMMISESIQLSVGVFFLCYVSPMLLEANKFKISLLWLVYIIAFIFLFKYINKNIAEYEEF